MANVVTTAASLCRSETQADRLGPKVGGCTHQMNWVNSRSGSAPTAL